MNKLKILYYTTPYGYGHVVRGNCIAEELGNQAEIHMVSGVDIIFKLSSNIRYHRIGEIPGMSRLDYEIYYYGAGNRTSDIERGKYIGKYRIHFKRFVDLLYKTNPDLVVVDVTPEFAIYSRLLGYRTVQLLLTGEKDDLRCKVSYASVNNIIAPYPRGFMDTSYWPTNVQKKIFWSGAFSRFDNKKVMDKDEAKKKVLASQNKKLIVCTFGRGDLGNMVIEEIERLKNEKDFSDCEFRILKGVENVADYLNAADCIISGAGDNTVAETSYFRTPNILIPLERGYGEQYSKAKALERMGAARILLEGDVRQHLKLELKKLLNDNEYKIKSKKAQEKFVDGRGTKRIAEKIIEWGHLEPKKPLTF